jgi:hypothetical protein
MGRLLYEMTTEILLNGMNQAAKVSGLLTEVQKPKHDKLQFYPGDGGTRFFKNVYIYLQIITFKNTVIEIIIVVRTSDLVL